MDDFYIVTPYAFGLVCELLKLLYAIANSDLGFKTLVRISKMVLAFSRMLKNLLTIDGNSLISAYKFKAQPLKNHSNDQQKQSAASRHRSRPSESRSEGDEVW